MHPSGRTVSVHRLDTAWTGLEEWLLGTDLGDPDTDGGGRTDGEEVLVDGTDPLNGADDLP